MMSSHKKRYLDQVQERQLKQEGLCFEGEIHLRPPTGGGRLISLKRTKIEIKLAKTHSSHIGPLYWQLPAFDYPVGHFCFELIFPKTTDTKDFERGRYLLKSLDTQPFRLNGAPCFEAFLQQGDQVKLGHNVLVVNSDQKFNGFKSSHGFSKELVNSELSIILMGESGTGKTYMAKKIHEQSQRRGEFVHVNLSSFSQGLIESELFGHIKGAFTGASKDKGGAFRQAQNGTLFLDEIDSLPLDLQTKLLLFLEDKKVRPVGSEKSYFCQTRLIFASGRNLQHLVFQEKMRKDFYFRITSGASACLSPLRKSPLLIEKMCQNFAYENNLYLSAKLIAFYKKLSWPGNIRQLLGHLEKKRICHKGPRIDLCEMDLNLEGQCWRSYIEEGNAAEMRNLEDVKLLYCEQVYQRLGENLKMASKALGVSANTLRNNLERLKAA